jgi:hypothetical protein
MEKQKLISLSDAFKKSFDLIKKNENIGFIFKAEIIAMVAISIILIPLFIGVVILSTEASKSTKNNETTLPKPLIQQNTTTYNMYGKHSLLALAYPTTTDNTDDAVSDTKLMPNEFTGNNTYTDDQSINDSIDFNNNNLNQGIVPESKPLPTPSTGVVIAMLVTLVITIILFTLFITAYTNMSIYTLLRVYNSNLQNVTDLGILSLKKIGPMMLLMFLQGLLIGVGYLLFIVPGFYFSYKFLFAPYILLEENCSPIEAMKRSSKLTSGYKLALFGRHLLLGLIIFLLILPIILFIYFSRISAAGAFAGRLGSAIIQMLTVVFYYDLIRLKQIPEVIAPRTNTEELPNMLPTSETAVK